MSLKSRIARLEQRSGRVDGFVLADLLEGSEQDRARRLAEARAEAEREGLPVLVLMYVGQELPGGDRETR